MANTSFAPRRYTFSETQAAAAIALAGLRPDPRSRLGRVPPPRDPVAALKGTDALSDGSLTADLAAALGVAVAPRLALSVVSNRAGNTEWHETAVLRGDADRPFVARAETGGLDLTLLPTEAQALVAVDAALALTDFPAEAGGQWALSLTGYAALLAVADALQQSELRARLARGGEAESTWDADALEAALTAGLEGTDTRWAVTAARFLSPVPLAGARGRLVTGIAELSAAGLARRDGAGWSLSDAGAAVATALAHLVVTGGLTVMAPEVARVPIAQATVFRTVSGILTAVWSEVSADAARVELGRISAVAALEFVRALLGLRPERT